MKSRKYSAFLSLSFVVLLSSCASSYEIQTGSCQRSTLVASRTKGERIVIRKIGFLKTKIKLKDALLKEGYFCEGLSVGQVEIRSTFMDSLINLVPFMTSHTLVVEIISKK